MEIVGSLETSQPRRPLSASLIEAGILSREEVEEAFAAESRTGETLAEFALRTHRADEEQIGRLLAHEWGLPFVTDELSVDPRGVVRLPLTVACKLGAVPIGFEDDKLVVAIAKPGRVVFARVMGELGKVSFVVVPASTLERLLAHAGALSAGNDTTSDVSPGPSDTLEPAATLTGAQAAAAPVDTIASPRPAGAAEGDPAPSQSSAAGAILQGEVLERLRNSEDELRTAHEELRRRGEVQGELQKARDELNRLRVELAAREAELQAAAQASERDAETIRRLEQDLSDRVSKKRSKKKSKQ